MVAQKMREIYRFYWQPALDVWETNKVGKHYLCNECKKLFPRDMVNRDHIEPVGRTDDLERVFNNLFVEFSAHQLLCIFCHRIKTKIDNKKMKA